MGQGAEEGEESLPEVWEEDGAGLHIHLQVSVLLCEGDKIMIVQCDLCPLPSGVAVCSAPSIATQRPITVPLTTRARAGR